MNFEGVKSYVEKFNVVYIFYIFVLRPPLSWSGAHIRCYQLEAERVTCCDRFFLLPPIAMPHLAILP